MGRTTALRRTTFLVCVAGLLAGLAGCAARPAPTLPVPPAFPDYARPTVPPGLGAAATIEAFDSAWQRFQAGDIDDADRRLQRLLKQTPTFYPSAAALGLVELARRSPKRAVERFDQALSVEPAYLPALVGRGDALLADRREDEALSSFERALAVDPASTAIRQRVDVLRFGRLEDAVGRGQRAEADGRLPEARAAYTMAVQASPESGFLHRRLAALELRLGDLASAVSHAREAVRLDESDAAAHALLGDALRGLDDDEGALAAWMRAQALDPDVDVDTRVAEARERLALAQLPQAYRQIGQSPTLTRAHLASLIAIRLKPLLDIAARTRAPVMTDTRGHWAADWIRSVSESGVMMAFPNHTFQPEGGVTRAELAQAASRLLRILGSRQATWWDSWQGRATSFVDLDTRHLSYTSAAIAVAADVMKPSADGQFQAGRVVTGAEGIEVVARIEALVTKAGLKAARPAAEPRR